MKVKNNTSLLWEILPAAALLLFIYDNILETLHSGIKSTEYGISDDYQRIIQTKLHHVTCSLGTDRLVIHLHFPSSSAPHDLRFSGHFRQSNISHISRVALLHTITLHITMSVLSRRTLPLIQSHTRHFSSSQHVKADFTHAVIGAGAVGLAIARRLQQVPGAQVVLIEKHNMVGSETSSRNSEVTNQCFRSYPS